jgi:hypothetical protein
VLAGLPQHRHGLIEGVHGHQGTSQQGQGGRRQVPHRGTRCYLLQGPPPRRRAVHGQGSANPPPPVVPVGGPRQRGQPLPTAEALATGQEGPVVQRGRQLHPDGPRPDACGDVLRVEAFHVHPVPAERAGVRQLQRLAVKAPVLDGLEGGFLQAAGHLQVGTQRLGLAEQVGVGVALNQGCFDPPGRRQAFRPALRLEQALRLPQRLMGQRLRCVAPRNPLVGHPAGAGGQGCEPQQQTCRGGRHHRPVPPGPLARPLGQAGPPGLDRLVLPEAAQVVGQLLGRAVALRRVLLQRLEQHHLQLLRHGLVQLPRRPGLVEGDLPQQLLAVAALEDRP